ncbi:MULTISPECIES: DUF4232 domain-containing protein [unclassified Rathayibacter]|uniref:DUF4232 domain-containing protein n=1 Tax=unclassified Rathayibacter TaxID=2609250 RepID=UPI00188C0D16|nr:MULTISPECIES: DUF4232 domain-containing protein [unclassified Rathayibacter]MBF4462666.1 DUF4232 domain-containing protein [Rathayibacter sp. VKM Ac-2879]MBF4504080.1 DUF4232 domain-containing protein [Rathayibacter sp. VKM Ac-2878]
MSIQKITAVGTCVLIAGLLLSGCSGRTGAPNGVTTTPASSPVNTVATTSTPTPTPSTTASASVCQDEITVQLEETPEEVAGSGYLVFSNGGERVCDISGFPLVSFIDDAGTPFGTQDEADANAVGGQVVHLEAGTQAYAWKRWIPAESTNGDCGNQVHAAGLRVQIPGATRATSLPINVTLCSATSYAQELSVGPIDAERRTASKGY